MDGGQRGRIFVTWHRCVTDGKEHAITDEEFASDLRRAEGRCEAVCGYVVTLESMMAGPGRNCRRCQTYLEARETLRSMNERMAQQGLPVRRHRRPGRLVRLLRRSQSPAVPSSRRGLPHSDVASAPFPGRDGRFPAPAGATSPFVVASAGVATRGGAP